MFSWAVIEGERRGCYITYNAKFRVIKLFSLHTHPYTKIICIYIFVYVCIKYMYIHCVHCSEICVEKDTNHTNRCVKGIYTNVCKQESRCYVISTCVTFLSIWQYSGLNGIYVLRHKICSKHHGYYGGGNLYCPFKIKICAFKIIAWSTSTTTQIDPNNQLSAFLQKPLSWRINRRRLCDIYIYI